MSKSTGILITFQNGDRHIITAPPGRAQQQSFTSLARWFDELAHDGDHDHDRFAQVRIRQNYSFDPAKVSAQVWPDVVSYLAQFEIDADPEQDEQTEYFASLVDEPYPMVEPLNVVNAHGSPNEDGTYTYLASCDVVLALMLNRNTRTGKLDPEVPIMPLGEYGFHGMEIHRPTPDCSPIDSEHPTCPVALAEVTKFREHSLRRKAEQAAHAAHAEGGDS